MCNVTAIARCCLTPQCSSLLRQHLRLLAKRGDKLCCKTSIRDDDDGDDDDDDGDYEDDEEEEEGYNRDEAALGALGRQALLQDL